MPKADDLTVESQPNPEDVEFLNDHINTLKMQRTGRSDYIPLGIFVRDKRGDLKAGVYAWTWCGCCEVKTLWVHEDRRGQGLGKHLLRAAETETLVRGCDLVVLDTHSFQAPGFYRKLGYEIVGVVEDYPQGHQKVFLKSSSLGSERADKAIYRLTRTYVGRFWGIGVESWGADT